MQSFTPNQIEEIAFLCVFARMSTTEASDYLFGRDTMGLDEAVEIWKCEERIKDELDSPTIQSRQADPPCRTPSQAPSG
jgi:hypothetical protein